MLTLLGAFGLALPLAWDREQADRSLGLRTFPLVALGACALVITARDQVSPDGVARVVEGVVSGIGFLGAAAVVKRGMSVHGTATAAAIWVTAAIGVAAGFGAWTTGIALSAVTFATLRWLMPLKAAVKQNGGPTELAHAMEAETVSARVDDTEDDAAAPLR
jgi:putative Mg2+ transporter-C (MgtC) family protein